MGAQTRRATIPSFPTRSSLSTRAWRWLTLVLHLLWGTVVVLGVFPFATRARRQTLRQHWSRRLLHLAGVTPVVSGAPLSAGSLLVANHVSWLDVFALNAVTPCAFVSKAEVRKWPVIGWLAAHNDTVFLRRGSRGHARIINGEIAALLTRGSTVAVFPEGTTSDGQRVLGFHAALLQPAIAASQPLQPVALRYVDAAGAYSAAPAYCGDMSLLASARQIIAARGLRVQIHVFPAIPTHAGSARRELAAQAHAQIADYVIDGRLAPIQAN